MCIENGMFIKRHSDKNPLIRSHQTFYYAGKRKKIMLAFMLNDMCLLNSVLNPLE